MPARAALIAAVLSLLGTGRVASAQVQTPEAPPPRSAVVLKGKAPVSDEILRVSLPRPQEADLANGLHLIVLEDRRVPQVSFRLVIPGAGGYFDPPELPGLASFTAAMMREGTTTRTSRELSEQLETMAASLSVGAGASSVDASVSGSSLTTHFEQLLELAADVLLRPSFPDEELARYRQRTRAQLIQQRSNPGFLAAEMFARVVYGEHPGGRVAPTPAALEKVTRENLETFHRARYVPDRAVLAIAGDISMADARTLVEARLEGWRKRGAPAPEVADPAPAGSRKVFLVSRPDSVQTNLIVGTQAIERTHADYDVLSVMNQVLGGGPTGRLFLILREEKGYTYGAGSDLDAGRYRGDWSASTSVRTEVTGPALQDLLAEVARMREEPVPETELSDAQRSMVASFALSLESPGRMLDYYLTQWRYGLPDDYWDRYPDRIMAVTPAQVQAAARKYLDPDRLLVVAVGDESKIGADLTAHGEVERYDTEGRRLPAP